MTPTNEIRAKLDELGIAWFAISETATEYTQEGILYRAYETRGGLQVAILTPVTPKQAIAATVGKDIERYDGSGRRGTVAILQGGRKPEEVLFVHDEGGVTHYLPEDAGTCKGEINSEYFECKLTTFKCRSCGWSGIVDNGYAGYSFGDTDMPRHCPNCGRKLVSE